MVINITYKSVLNLMELMLREHIYIFYFSLIVPFAMNIVMSPTLVEFADFSPSIMSTFAYF